jgi:T5SS/PEP-CTERM-associated repeat protein
MKTHQAGSLFFIASPFFSPVISCLRAVNFGSGRGNRQIRTPRKAGVVSTALAAILLLSIFGAAPAEAQPVPTPTPKTLIIDGATSPRTVPPDIKTGELFVGFTTTGLLNISITGTVSDINGFIGYNGPPNIISPSTGQVTVTGPNATWTNGGILYVGFFGTGSSPSRAAGPSPTPSAILGTIQAPRAT